MWKEPIFDRTQKDIDEQNSKGFCNTHDLNRLEENCAEVSALLGTAIIPRTVPWTEADLPTEAELDRISANISVLNLSYRAYQNTPQSPQGSLTHWEKWNDAEKILRDIYVNYRDNIAAQNYSGEISTGERIGVL